MLFLHVRRYCFAAVLCAALLGAGVANAQVNFDPVANAGPDLIVVEGVPFQLDGTGSYSVNALIYPDFYDGTLNYWWYQVDGPAIQFLPPLSGSLYSHSQTGPPDPWMVVPIGSVGPVGSDVAVMLEVTELSSLGFGSGFDTAIVHILAVPEPTSLALVGSLLGVAGIVRHRRRTS